MNEPARHDLNPAHAAGEPVPPAVAVVAALRLHTRHALAGVAQRLARSLAERLLPASVAPGPSSDELARALAFVDEHVASLPPLPASPQGHSSHGWPDHHPLTRLLQLPASAGQASSSTLCDLVLLACLPEAHEGLATLCRLVHPAQQPWPTVALALHWLEHEAAGPDADVCALRDAIEDLLCHAPLARLGLLRLEGDGPWHGRTLRAAPFVWPALTGRALSGEEVRLALGYRQVPGLDAWLAQPEVAQAVLALRRGLSCQLLLVGGDAAMRHTRARALLGAAQTSAVLTPVDDADGGTRDKRIGGALAAAWLYQSCLWLEDRRDDLAEPTALSGTGGMGLDRVPLEQALPIIVTAATERRCPPMDLPQIRLPVQPLAPVARRALWQSLLPQLGDQVPQLAARYPIEPDDARDVVRDLSLRQRLHGQPLALDDVGACVRARTAWHARPGISRVLPQADWSALLLPQAAIEPLQSAVRRVLQQITVLDDWGFEQGRTGRRGVRMLFYGPPGTGKTLAAEVMARALGVDLLVVDLSALVSKYIGETEKNLAAVFDVAERSRALLLFDEADALFGKRTDAQDAHDRYANMETAYLLQRLERYEGVAVLTTNLRGQLDKAFTRRFEAIVEFAEPDAGVREALWKLHLPPAAPLAPDVNLRELAEWYAIAGAQIKNAALAAAFLAASNQARIAQRHFLWAIEREFDKAGRAHPGFPPQYVPLQDTHDTFGPSPDRSTA